MHLWYSTRSCHILRPQPVKWLQPSGRRSSPRVRYVSTTVTQLGVLAPRRTNSQAAVGRLHFTSRWIPSRTHTSKQQAAAPPPWTGAAILTNDNSHTKIEQVLERIEPLSATNHRTERPHNVVFLFSRAFASWPNHFLPKALARLYSECANYAGERETGSNIIADVKVLAAVVDCIPAPSSLQMMYDSSNNEDASSVRPNRQQQHSQQEEHGLEGIAYCAFEEDSRFRIQELGSRLESFTQLGEIEKGTLSICLQPRDATASASLDVTSVTLPLASTVFSTGRPHTMHFSQWRWDFEKRTFNMYLHKETAHQAVHLPVAAPGQHLGTGDATTTRQVQVLEHVISAPLVALTAPRQVEDCMGNIVRRLKTDDGTVFPASEELEASVATFFDQSEITPQPVSVWALLVAKSIVEKHPNLLHRLHETQPDSERRLQDSSRVLADGAWAAQNSLDVLLKAGATLHRVISGGGGWGNKAGLLSLDANAAYGPSPVEGLLQQADETPSQEEVDAPPDFQKMFGGVASQGDYVTFFLPPMFPPDTTAHGLLDNDSSSQSEQSCIGSLAFGVIPSTIDSIVTGARSEAETETKQHQPTLQVFAQHFGALSEGGMSIEMLRASDASHFKTKVDVPFARLSCITTIVKKE